MVTMFEHEFEIGETVYLKTDKESKPRIIIGIIKYESSYLYSLVCEESNCFHYEFEITKEQLFV